MSEKEKNPENKEFSTPSFMLGALTTGLMFIPPCVQLERAEAELECAEAELECADVQTECYEACLQHLQQVEECHREVLGLMGAELECKTERIDDIRETIRYREELNQCAIKARQGLQAAVSYAGELSQCKDDYMESLQKSIGLHKLIEGISQTIEGISQTSDDAMDLTRRWEERYSNMNDIAIQCEDQKSFIAQELASEQENVDAIRVLHDNNRRVQRIFRRNGIEW